jgi:peptidoglycan/xylan/chitin deacetylase (PgdA/CDA1 family)
MNGISLRQSITSKAKVAATGAIVAVSLLAACGEGGGGSASAGTNSPGDGGTIPAITSVNDISVSDGIDRVFFKASASITAGRSAAWSLSGTDSDRLAINSTTGELSFIAAPKYGAPSDLDGDNKYKVTLTVSDGTRSTKQDLTIEVLPWNTGGDGGLPVPLGHDVPKPSGTTANLKVLPWAGFKSAVSYTFDDSSPSQIENWPTLKAQGVRMTFYVNPPGNWFPGYDATWRDAVAQGSEIGNHTMHHCRASQLNGADPVNCPKGLTIEEEMDQTTDYIVSRLGQSGVWTMAYPFGDLGYQSVAKEKFFLSRGVNPGTIGASEAIDSSNLPIIGHAGDPTTPGGDPVSVFNKDIDAGSDQGRWTIFLIHVVLPTSQDWGGGENVAMIAENMSYAKGLGTVWIDSVANIGAYWTAQQLLEKATPVTQNGTTTWNWTVPKNFPPGRKLRVTVSGGALSQNGTVLPWNNKGYYELSIDAGTLSWTQ